jgi:signal transduction histidine kinase
MGTLGKTEVMMGRPHFSGRPTAAAVLTAGVWLAVAANGMSADHPETAGSIDAILALPLEELDSPHTAVVRGIMTLVDPPVIQDGDDAIYLDPTRLPVGRGQHWREVLEGVPLEVGADVEVSGFVDPGGYAPRLVVRSIRRLGTAPLPEPLPIDVARLFAGGDVGRRVLAAGVVQAVLDQDSTWAVVFDSAGRRFTVTVKKDVVPDRPDQLVDAEVEITGVGRSFRNTRGELIAPGLYVARREDVRLLREPGRDPFELPITPLGSIARYRSTPLAGHRLRTSGVVSFVGPGMLYLQEGIGGVRVDLTGEDGEPPAFSPGDRVEVAGFPDMSSGVGAIAWAVVRMISAGEPPAPRAIQPTAIMRINVAHDRSGEVARPGTYDGCLIRCLGRIEAVNNATDPRMITLTEDGTIFTASFSESPPDTLVVGSEVEITGIVELRRDDSAGAGRVRTSPRVGQLNLLVRGADDLRVVRLPPWWTPARFAAVAGVLGTIALASIVWVTFLRREVSRQTARAVAEESARQKASLDYEITLRERNQLAANLHDTALQTVTGIAFQLKVCEAKDNARSGGAPADGGDGDVGRHLGVARKMVEHAADQLRGTVWSLRSLPTDGRTFSEALGEVIGRVGAGHSVEIRLDFAPPADRIAAYVAGNLLLVVQEAVHNAIHHASPRTIEISVSSAEPGAVTAVVRDDGKGFTLGSQAGPRQGHFGLAGMRERVERLGGTFEITSSPGEGTTLRADVPGRQAAAAAQHDVHAWPPPHRTMTTNLFGD